MAAIKDAWPARRNLVYLHSETLVTTARGWPKNTNYQLPTSTQGPHKRNALVSSVT